MPFARGCLGDDHAMHLRLLAFADRHELLARRHLMELGHVTHSVVVLLPALRGNSETQRQAHVSALTCIPYTERGEERMDGGRGR
eukprot:5372846-Heterocapsa_arctica.AAC.1